MAVQKAGVKVFSRIDTNEGGVGGKRYMRVALEGIVCRRCGVTEEACIDDFIVVTDELAGECSVS
jgi:hypothetical protein